MNFFYYAQLDDSGVCIGVSCLSGEVEIDNMVNIPEYDEDYLYRKYENEQWSEEKFIPDYGQIELDRMEAVEQAIAELSIIFAGGGQ